MKRMLVCLFAIFGLLMASAGASAASLEEAQSLYNEGHYDAAADMAASLDTTGGYTLATKSLLGKTSLLPRKERSKDEIDRAIGYAQKAFEIDPENLDAHLQYATALGLRGRLISKVRAQLEGLPEEAHVHLEIAVELAPDHAWANAFLAAWHIEVVRKGGATLAKSIYGAELETGIEMYDRALTQQPMSVVLPYEYAQFILALDYWTYRDKADGLLDMALALPPKNHQERAVHGRASAIKAGVTADDPKVVLDLVAKHLGAKRIKVPRKPKV